jgi:hypothetical protein
LENTNKVVFGEYPDDHSHFIWKTSMTKSGKNQLPLQHGELEKISRGELKRFRGMEKQLNILFSQQLVSPSATPFREIC